MRSHRTSKEIYIHYTYEVMQECVLGDKQTNEFKRSNAIFVANEMSSEHNRHSGKYIVTQEGIICKVQSLFILGLTGP
jgi:hypothetical protein